MGRLGLLQKKKKKVNETWSDAQETSDQQSSI